MIRWKPYALRARMREAEARDEEEDIERRAREMFALDDEADDDFFGGDDGSADEFFDEEEEADWLPERPVMDEEDEQQAIERAEAMPDDALASYPGRRYSEQTHAVPAQDVAGETQRYAAVHHEGPGAAEVSRRRAEIDAWQQQMQDEARAERMRRLEEMRSAEAAKQAEEERLAQEARRAQEEKAQEESRRAQEEYRRQLEEYERQKAQYEQEMAQYERDLAAYEAAMAQRQADAETAQEIAPETGEKRSRARHRTSTYSDMVQGDAVEALPGTPAWPKMEETVSTVKRSAAPKERTAKSGGLMGRMAHLIEPEQEEISGVGALPPRVDPQEAYKPAAQPEGTQRRRRK